MTLLAGGFLRVFLDDVVVDSPSVKDDTALLSLGVSGVSATHGEQNSVGVAAASFLPLVRVRCKDDTPASPQSISSVPSLLASVDIDGRHFLPFLLLLLELLLCGVAMLDDGLDFLSGKNSTGWYFASD